MKTLLKNSTVLILGATFLIADSSASLATNNDGSQSIKYTIDMTTGWNMFAVPGYKAYKVNDLLGDNDSVDKVYQYDKENSAWLSFSAEESSGEVKELIPGIGYWINARENMQLIFESNVSSIGEYEMASIVMNPNQQNQKMMNIPTAGYNQMWTSNGTLETNFSQGYGSTNWDVAKSGNGNTFWNKSTNSMDWMYTENSGTNQTGWTNYMNDYGSGNMWNMNGSMGQ